MILIRSRHIVRKHGFLKIGFCFSRSGSRPCPYLGLRLVQAGYAYGYFALSIPVIADKIRYRFDIKRYAYCLFTTIYVS